MWKRPALERRRLLITNPTIEATTIASEPKTTPTTIAVIWEPPVCTLQLPVVVGTGVSVFELRDFELVEVERAFGCDVGVGTKVSIGVEDGEGGV